MDDARNIASSAGAEGDATVAEAGWVGSEPKLVDIAAAVAFDGPFGLVGVGTAGEGLK